MNKQKIKLGLNKETLQVINDFEMSQVNGGEDKTSSFLCYVSPPIPSWLINMLYGGGNGGSGKEIKSTWYQSGADTRPVLATNCNLRLY
jgi:hypothetical protein